MTHDCRTLLSHSNIKKAGGGGGVGREGRGGGGGGPNVVGKERVKFYSRPVVPGNQSLVPVIKYAPDVSRSGDDFTADFLARRDSYDSVRRSVSKVASVSVQTLYRETETQTEPYTPSTAPVTHADTDQDLLALSSLTHGDGLPLHTEFDVERVRRLIRLQQEELQMEELENGERKEMRERILSERQELDWESREQAAAEMKNHRENALDGYIKVTAFIFRVITKLGQSHRKTKHCKNK